MAERFPNARITAVSNSRPQRDYIERQAMLRQLRNLTVITADMNDFAIHKSFDRVVSIEMFEHMANWQSLLARVRAWLKPGGRLFIHVFSHDRAPYRFDHGDANDWIAQHFFTGGIMPSHGLIHRFPDLFMVEQEWRWSGTHYRRTALDWLANYDANAREIGIILRKVYGRDAGLWRRRWRMFFLATAELFGYDDGRPWGVSHYRLRASE
jgi:cyclopropane-fatty-acyl-phospholipid synthase